METGVVVVKRSRFHGFHGFHASKNAKNDASVIVEILLMESSDKRVIASIA
jgi:hypothetical protein